MTCNLVPLNKLQWINSVVLSELGQYALAPTAPGLAYELGPSGMSYAGAAPAGYQRSGSPSYQRARSPSPSYKRSGSPSAGYQSASYQPSSYQSPGYQSATNSSDYPSLYPVLPVSGQAAAYPGSSQYSSRSFSPRRDGPAGPVPYSGGSQYPGPSNSSTYNSPIGSVPTSMPAMNSTETVCTLLNVKFSF